MQSSICKKILLSAEHATVHKIRPLCPTRWLVRVDAINALLSQYESVLDMLEEHAKSPGSNAGAKASGVLHHIQRSSTVLGLCMYGCGDPGSCRKFEQSIASMWCQCSWHDGVTADIAAMRTEADFKAIMQHCRDLAGELNLEPLVLPRVRKPRPITPGQPRRIPRRISKASIDLSSLP